MSWPIDETYTLSRRELEELLHDTCWEVVEIMLKHDPNSQNMPFGLVEIQVQEALDSLFLRVQ